MNQVIDELDEIAKSLRTFVAGATVPDIQDPLKALEESAREISKAWSGSWFGYHSRIYYAELSPPPPGAHFSSEWGFLGEFQGTTGDWREYDFDAVKQEVFQRAGNPDLRPARKVSSDAKQTFDDRRDQVVSILEAIDARSRDSFIERLLEEVRKEQPISVSDYIQYRRPAGTLMSRDSLAVNQGLQVAPHLSVLAEVVEIRSRVQSCEVLAKTCSKAAAHLGRLSRRVERAGRIGTNVFIGHGRSPVWKDFKDLLQDRLRLPWDEFNRVPVAGVTNVARLAEMLDDAAVAFIVMTGEDEQVDGQLRARTNVVHEAGLFQGRLGFTKAIVLLEEGCEEFSNIQGLGQIRFPKGNIQAIFEEIRRVLEREDLIEP